MIKYNFNEYCSGCGVCVETCPVGAIQMVPQESQKDMQNVFDYLRKNINKKLETSELPELMSSQFNQPLLEFSGACGGCAESVYANYYEYSEPVNKIAGHRVLAIDRGEREKFLKVSVTLDAVKAANIITSATLNPDGSPTTETSSECPAASGTL